MDRLAKVVRLARDRDFRAFIRHVMRDPRQINLARPSVQAGIPAYLSAGLQSEIVDWTQPPALLHWGTGQVSDPKNIALAATELPIRSIGALPWDATFEDNEDEAALHRFAWLLPWLLEAADTGATAADTWRLAAVGMRSWIGGCGGLRHGEAWHAYTISERIINWIFASLLTGSSLQRETDIASSIHEQGEFLFRHLEYYDERFTGNHLSNNGRALYIAGTVLHDPQTAARGREIVLRERERLFPEPFFFREGSSHYQFLLTRNYCELLWFAARAGDRRVVRELLPTVGFLEQGCRFFLMTRRDGTGVIPLIGDISPDCDPEWLMGVPHIAARLVGRTPPPTSPPRRGWHRLLDSTAAAVGEATSALVASKEWGRVDRDGWTMFMHVNPSGAPIHPGHAHQDSGAIVLFRDGEPIITESVRLSYRRVDDWGKSSSAHSMFVIDDAPPAPDWYWIYSDQFLGDVIGERPIMTANDSSIEVKHGGYRRINGVGSYRRIVEVASRNSVVIRDELEGSGEHHAALTFHMPPQSQNVRITFPDGFSVREKAGSDAAAYGAPLPLRSMLATKIVTLPWTGTTTVEVN